MVIKNKIKILMISSSSSLGGGTKHMFMLGESLKEDFEIFYAIPKNNYFSDYLNENNHIEIAERKINLDDILNLNKFIKKNSINILHAHGKGAGVLGRILNIFQKKVLIYNFHGIHFKFHNYFIRFLYLLYENAMGKLDTHKVFVSESEKLYAKQIKIFYGRNINVINNGVYDLPKKEFLNKEEIYKKNKSNFKIKVISICRFVKQKNVLDILKIARKLPEINFVIIGDGELRNIIKERMSTWRLKNVELKGSQEDVFKFLYEADIYLSTSIYEGLPISILEAMSIGLPVVASNVMGNLDTIKNKESGFLFDLNNLDEGINFIKILAMDRNLRILMGDKAFKRQRMLFSFNKMVHHYRLLYRKYI